MLNVKEATEKAWNYLLELYGNRISNLQLEEVELSEDGGHWLITLSYNPASHFDVVMNPKINRDYKVFKINSNTGDILYMKIREVG